jgi:transposase
MIARGGQASESGEALRGQARQMGHGWPRGRDGTLAPASFAHSRWPIRREVERRLDVGQTGGVPKPEGGCRESLNGRPALWTVVRHDGVEPTTHAAERAIRPGGLWRTGSCGTPSADGSRVVDAIMPVVATRKPQHGNVLDDLTAACEAARRGDAAPAWLPPHAHLDQDLHHAA